MIILPNDEVEYFGLYDEAYKKFEYQLLEVSLTSNINSKNGLLAFYNPDDEEIKRYVDFCISHKVGVKGTEHLFEEKFTKVCETAWAVGRAMKISTPNCGIGLDLLRES